MSINLLQQLNTISNPAGNGVPVSQYVQEYQSILTHQLESAPNQELSTLSAQQSALTALQSALGQFQSATQTLASLQAWTPATVTSSSSAFSATTQAGAQPATYSISVTQLAQSQLDVATVGQSSTSGSSSIAAGSFTITSNNGGTATVNITANESLNNIAAAINQFSSTTDVSASIINSGSGSTPYYIALQSTQTGSNYGFSLNDSSGGTYLSTNFGFPSTPNQAAQNAQITLDGSVNVLSSSNTFTNAIPNVTLNVSQTTSSAGTLTIAQNQQSIVKAVQTWMNSYNSLIDLVHKDTSYTPGTATQPSSAGPLFNDPNATGVLSQLPGALNTVLGSGAENSLASVGIVVNPTTGHLEFQPAGGFGSAGATLQDGQTMFTNALQSNASAVQQLFGVVQNAGASSAVPTTGVLGNVNTTLNEFIGGNGQTGTIQSDLTGIQSQQTSLNNYIAQLNQLISQNVANFTKQLNSLNASLAQSQSQMQMLSALIGGSGTSSSSGGTSASIP